MLSIEFRIFKLPFEIKLIIESYTRRLNYEIVEEIKNMWKLLVIYSFVNVEVEIVD